MADNNLQPLLEVKDLSMHFVNGKRRKQSIVKAVDHVSFDIYPGETFGMVGESGCGKTTCGRTIIRLYDPTGGQIFYKGVEISGKMTREKRKFITENIAMVFQDPIASLNPRMTVQEIIGEGLKIRGMEDPAEREKVVVDMLERVGLQKEHATRYPHEFSGGQRQRIGIARALVVKPSMIIADEPVSALDVSVQAQVINLLNDLKEEFGLTIMFIAHNLSVVKYFCDRIAVMYFGKLVELATSDELFAHPCHPYTRALLSAIPLPDPVSEKTRVRLSYEPPKNRDESLLSYHTVAEGHTVLCTDEEFEEIMKNY
ncbi:MAG: ATP-binding cassette domain-containing protein [Firmicutes bacterium]|nr:ATP-binding cassette domain-containing protein [Bacillota bacterium]MBQ6013465.1 ATP-binding cassette domain-containing protein [Bacillota bacterium]MBQ6260957.1 ATP-binding cassette domain-containing protein [Bacillota bacterium]MBR0114520.1 ATP-binding cassette domain-containing protein [Bacillota bacterium]MBR0442696.1 ATP-binding cassette domain-containing protein [Bacillota bacterium]